MTQEKADCPKCKKKGVITKRMDGLCQPCSKINCEQCGEKFLSLPDRHLAMKFCPRCRAVRMRRENR